MRSIFHSGHPKALVSQRLLVIILILFTTILFRIPFLTEPLDRDSGEFALRGYIWGHGHMPYSDIGSSRPPGLDFLFMILFKLFQPSSITVNLFVLCWAVLNTSLVYLLSRILFNNFWVSCLTIILYAFFSSSPFIEGTGAMTEYFMITFTMLGFYFLIKAARKQKLRLFLISGLSFGLGFLFKQVAIFDFFAILIYLLILYLLKENNLMSFFKRVFIVTAAFLLPFGACLLYFNYKGILEEFIFCIFTFNFNYVKTLGYQTGNFWGKFISFNSNIFKTNSIIWIGAIAFISFLWSNLYSNKHINKEFYKENKYKFLLAFWGICSFVGLCSSGRFFPHYYIVILPSFVLMAGFIFTYLLSNYQRAINRTVMLICLILSIAVSLYFHYDYYLKFSPEEISMHQYAWEPFVEAKEVGLYIRARTKPDDLIFVWAEEPEIHFYSLRNSTCKYWSDTPFVYYRAIFKNAEDVLLSSLHRKAPIYFVIDTRHFGILKRYQNIYNYIINNYCIEGEVKVVRQNLWGYSLLICRLKQQ